MRRKIAMQEDVREDLHEEAEGCRSLASELFRLVVCCFDRVREGGAQTGRFECEEALRRGAAG